MNVAIIDTHRLVPCTVFKVRTQYGVKRAVLSSRLVPSRRRSLSHAGCHGRLASRVLTVAALTPLAHSLESGSQSQVIAQDSIFDIYIYIYLIVAIYCFPFLSSISFGMFWKTLAEDLYSAEIIDLIDHRCIWVKFY